MSGPGAPTLEEAIRAQAGAEGRALTRARTARRVSLGLPADGRPIAGLGLGDGPGTPSTMVPLRDTAAMAARGRLVGATHDGCLVVAYSDLVVALWPRGVATLCTGVARADAAPVPGDLAGLAEASGDRLLGAGEREDRAASMRADPATEELVRRALDLVEAVAGGDRPIGELWFEGAAHGRPSTLAPSRPTGRDPDDPLVLALAAAASAVAPRLAWARVEEGHPGLASGWKVEPPAFAVEPRGTRGSALVDAAARRAAARGSIAWVGSLGLPPDVVAAAREELSAWA